MNICTVLITLAAAASATSIHAQDQVNEADRAEIRIARGDTALETLEQRLRNGTMRASALIGTEVDTHAGESVGEVADVLTPTTGRGMQVVVEGGSEGLDRKTIAVALDDIRVNADGDQLLTVSTREQLAAAPQVAPNGRGIADLIGANVVGIDGEDVGEVDDVLLSTAGGRSARAVLQVGGVAGIGEKRIALPLEQLKIDRVGRDEPAVSVAMNLAGLEQQPEFTYE